MIIDGKVGLFKRKISAIFEEAGRVLEENFSRVNVSISFVSADEIKELNGRFRNVDKATDVLSFPNLNKFPKQKLTEFESERNIDDGLLFLGDIVICKDVAKKQAKEYGHSLKREICFLALHSLLHLLGYDHIEKEDEEEMQKIAKEILKNVGVNR